MDIEYVKRIHFHYRELMVDRLSKINKKQCYVDLFKFLRTHGVPYTKKEAGIFFTLNDLEQGVVYQLDDIITRDEQSGHK